MTKRKPEPTDTFTYTIEGVVKHTNIKQAQHLKPGDRTDWGVVKAVYNRRIFTYVQFNRDDDRLVLKTLPHNYRVAFTATDEPVHLEMADGTTATITPVSGDPGGGSVGPLPAEELDRWEGEGGH